MRDIHQESLGNSWSLVATIDINLHAIIESLFVKIFEIARKTDELVAKFCDYQ
jgi:hypothetical protein